MHEARHSTGRFISLVLRKVRLGQRIKLLNERDIFCSVVLVVGSSVEPVSTSLRGPVITAAGANYPAGFLFVLACSPLLLEDIIDVVHFAKSLKEGDEIQELSV